MQIQVLYFAVFRERLSLEGEALALPAGARVRDAVAALASRHAVVAQLTGRFRVAVGHAMVDDDHVLADGDELALIPPVAGGSGPHARLLDGPLSLDRCLAAVSSAAAGGIVTFTGQVRRESRGVAVERLEYEAYAPMVERVFAALVDEVEAEWPGVRIALEHRVGRLALGEAAVVIAAAAPHRAEAFAACRAVIDRLKDRAPIWKKEFGADGAVWVGLGP